MSAFKSLNNALQPFTVFRGDSNKGAFREFWRQCDFTVWHLVCGVWQVWGELDLWKSKAHPHFWVLPLACCIQDIVWSSSWCENSLLVLSPSHQVPFLSISGEIHSEKPAEWSGEGQSSTSGKKLCFCSHPSSLSLGGNFSWKRLQVDWQNYGNVEYHNVDACTLRCDSPAI